jgi:peroxiredoxin
VNTETMKNMVTSEGTNLYEISKDKSVMLVFLRHFGCIFCKEALFDLSKKRKYFEQGGIQLVFVHMATAEVADDYFKTFKLDSTPHISDPETVYYQRFGLIKGNTSQLMGLKNWVRGFEVSVGKGIEVSIRQIGDAFQMPGVFVIKDGVIQESFIHKTPADRPDYEKLVACCAISSSN